MRLRPTLYFNVLGVTHYHKCSWKTCIYAHTHTFGDCLITAVNDQCFISPSQLGWQGKDTAPSSLLCVSNHGNHGDISSVSSAPALIKNLQPVLGLHCNWRPLALCCKGLQSNRRRGLPRCVICLELPIKIETFIQITLCRFCKENVKCLI